MTEVLANFYEKYMPSSIVPRITSNEFDDNGFLTGSASFSGKSIVFFYKEESRFSYDFADQFTKFTVEDKEKKYKTYAIDSSSEEGKKLTEKSKKFGYIIGAPDWQWPTIMVFINNIPCCRYTGGRTSDELKSFLEYIKTDLCDEKVPVKTLFKDVKKDNGNNKCEKHIYIIVFLSVLLFILFLYILMKKNGKGE